MNKVFRIFCLVSIIVFALINFACGSKRNPTGGAVDTVKPELLTSLPAEFADIRNQTIELSFSKYLDKSSVTTGLYIYPPIQNKKVSVERNKIFIKINEELLPNTNYYVTLTSRIKDIRGNSLAENQTLIYASGDLQRNRLSGTLSYENDADRAFPLQFTLLSADSLQVFSKAITGGAFALDELNPVSYLYRAFIDKNSNGRYDLGQEPWNEGRVNVRGIVSIDLNMAYADTVLPRIRSVRAVSNREVLVSLSETISSLVDLRITGANNSELPILANYLDRESLVIVTAEQTRADYELVIMGLRDPKGNVNRVQRSRFTGSTAEDTVGPTIMVTTPRNGTSVHSLKPELLINFSEVIDPSTVNLELRSSDGNQSLPFERLTTSLKQLKVRPTVNLTANRSYTLTISSSLADYSGNRLSENYILNFLVLGTY